MSQLINLSFPTILHLTPGKCTPKRAVMLFTDSSRLTENVPILFLSFLFLTKLSWNFSLESRSDLGHFNPLDFSPSFTHISGSINSACRHCRKCQLLHDTPADPLSIPRPRESYSHRPLTFPSCGWHQILFFVVICFSFFVYCVPVLAT